MAPLKPGNGVGPPHDVQVPQAFPSSALPQKAQDRQDSRCKSAAALSAQSWRQHFCASICCADIQGRSPLQRTIGLEGRRLIPKGKGSPSDPLSYRSIFLSGFTAKLYHMSLREHLNTIWEAGIHGLQIGGRKAHGVDMAHHCIQAHSHWTQVRGLPYSVLRQSLFADEEQPVALVAALHRYGVSFKDIEDMLHGVQDEFVAEPLSPHFQLLLRDAMKHTHFRIKGFDAVCHTHRGT